MENNNYRFGVNYVPSKDWFYSWQHINLSDVESDFKAISSLGVDHIRMHLRWDLFQPNGLLVDKLLLKNLSDILDIAEQYNLMAEVSVFTGWMSGFWFLPSYCWEKNIVTDVEQWKYQKFYLQCLSNSLNGHKAFMGIDLGNEINVYGRLIRKFSVEEGDRWVNEMLTECNRLFPNKINVVGVDHVPWFFDSEMSRSELATAGTVTSVHAWAGFTGALDFGIFSEECLCLQEYNIELANAYATDLNRKVWIQEFGISTCWTEEKNFEKFLTDSMLNATHSDNLFGFTFWCSHDVSRKLGCFNKMEYGLGLFDVDNKLKPLGSIFKNCISEIKKQNVEASSKYSAVIIDENEPFNGIKYLKIFADNIRQGVHIKFVLSSKSNDSDYLVRRGIVRLI